MSLLNKPTLISSESTSLITEKDVVVFLLWHLGDVLNSTALLPELVARHNQKLIFATTKPCVPILENNPYLDKILILDLEVPKKLSFEHFENLQELSQKCFPQSPTVYNLHFPIYLRRIYVHFVEHWAKEHHLHFPIYLRETRLHIVECWAKALGIEKPLSGFKPGYFTTQNQGYPFKYDNVFVLGNGGSTWIKLWPIKKWNEFVKIMEAQFPDIQLVQLGSKSDPLIDGVEDLRGKTTIDESYHLLKNSRGCLTNDSFLAHFAAVAGCPTFVIFGNTSPRHFRPLGHSKVFVFGGHLRCTPCLRDWCLLSLGLTRCLAFPSVAEIVKEVEKTLKRKSL